MDYGLDIGYNLFTTTGLSQTLLDFLAIKDPDWYMTQAVEETIQGNTGGTIIANDAKTEVEIPTNAVSGEVTFLFEPEPSPDQSVGVLSFAGNSFELTAQDSLGIPVTTFSEPLTLTLYYEESQLGSIPEEELYLFYWDTAMLSWMNVLSTCPSGEYIRDVDANWLSVPLCHLSEFALLGPPAYQIYIPLIEN